MNTYYRLKYFIIFLLIFYFIGGLMTTFIVKDREKEFLPLFSWFLFYKVPNEKYSTSYSIQIIEMDGKKINPPLLLTQAYGMVRNTSSPQVQSIARRLVLSVQRSNNSETKRLRQILEQVYLTPERIKYQPIIITYDPIERFKKGTYKVDVIADFEKR